VPARRLFDRGGLDALVPHAGYVIGTVLSELPSTMASALGRTAGGPVFFFIVLSLVSVALLAATAVHRRAVTPLRFYGGSLVVLAPALILNAVADRSSVTRALISLGIMKVSEMAAASVPLAYVATVVRGRAATLVVAGWLIVPLPLSALGQMAAAQTSPASVLWIGALLCAGGGLVLIRLAPSLRRRYFDRPGGDRGRGARSRRRSAAPAAP